MRWEFRMSETTVAEVLRRIAILAPKHQAATLRGLISSDPHGSRRAAFQQALKKLQEEQAA